ncbi:TonB-dependent siderophore receptor, partial [Bordetella hinzii]|nr:TonB-dependent siderophore receptor [Bordetella hinzii]
ASLAIGTDDYYRGTIDSNWKLGETSAFRLNLMYHDQNVAGRDVVDYSRWGVAPTFSFGLGTPTRVTLSYYHLQSDDTPDSGIPYKYPSTKVKADGSYMGVTSTGPANVDRDNFYGLTSDYRKTQTDMATVGIEHDITDRLMVRNTTRYTYSKQRYVVTQPDDSQGNVLNGLVWRRANTRVSDVETIANNTELTGKFDTGSLKHSFSMGLELSSEEGKKDALAVNRGTG